MNTYDSKSCSAGTKLHYRPIDAALRWCNLIEHEVKILTATGEAQFPPLGAFPQWPCLRSNVEKIVDAIENGDLAHGRDGKTVAQGDHVATARRTIRHSDLKNWMTQHYPDQKPKFLFDDIERTTHAAINADSFRALQVDRDALNARLVKAEEWAKKIIAEKNDLVLERDALNARVGSVAPLLARERDTFLKLVIGMAVKGYSYDPTALKSTAPKEIADDLAGLDITITDDTVRKYLREAASTVLPAKPRQL